MRGMVRGGTTSFFHFNIVQIALLFKPAFISGYSSAKLVGGFELNFIIAFFGFRMFLVTSETV